MGSQVNFVPMEEESATFSGSADEDLAALEFRDTREYRKLVPIGQESEGGLGGSSEESGKEFPVFWKYSSKTRRNCAESGNES